MTKDIVLSAEKHTYGLIKCLSYHASINPAADLSGFISFLNDKLDTNQQGVFQEKIKNSLPLNKYYAIFTVGNKSKQVKTNKF